LAQRLAEVEEIGRQQRIRVSKVDHAAAELEAERRRVRGDLRRELEVFRAQVAGRLREEEARLREAFAEGRRKGIAAAAVERLFEEAPEALVEPPGPSDLASVAPGDQVRHRELGWTGRVERVGDDWIEVAVAGKRVRCRLGELEVAPQAAVEGRVGVRPARAAVDEVPVDEVPAELHVIGQRVEPALEKLDAYLDQALLAGRSELRVVHGHGTGRLKRAVREHLRGHPAVASFRPGEPNEGGDGATVVTLRG
jgi:DNA mismatch repair protein MutS2